jgi:hypothetical protein
MEVKSNHEDPHQYSKGIDYVIINGKIVLEQDKFTENLPGTFLKHSK